MGQDLSCREFTELDSGLLSDFLGSVDEAQEEVEFCLDKLRHSPEDNAALNQLFRIVHSVKGNCRMVFLDSIVPVVHVLEEILEHLRQRKFVFSEPLGAFILEIQEITRSMIREAAERGCIDCDRRDNVVQVVNEVSHRLLARKPVDFAAVSVRLAEGSAQAAVVGLGELPHDMQIMKEYAMALDNFSSFRRGRAQQIWQLCNRLNQELGHPVDSMQLEAAVYMHDFGMNFISPTIVQKEAILEKDELRQIQQHVFFGARLLQRFGGWDEAALMVLQHHEHVNGGGYPYRLSGAQICVGAKMLAIADAFFALTNERSDRTYKKTLFGAVREINTNIGTQFDSEAVEAFNEVVRANYLNATSN